MSAAAGGASPRMPNGIGGWCADGSAVGQYAAKTYGTPIRSATEGAASCSAVAPTIASQPRAAAAIVSNCVATVASAS